MANSMFPSGTEGAGASNPSKGGKPSLDFRGPQEKGKPSHTTAHRQATGSGTAGAPAKVPNRSGSVRFKEASAAGDTDHVRSTPKSMGGINSKMKAPPRRNAR